MNFASGIITNSEVLHKQVSLQKNFSTMERQKKWVVAIDILISNIIALAKNLKKVLEGTYSAVRQLPDHNKKSQWKRSSQKKSGQRKRSYTTSAVTDTPQENHRGIMYEMTKVTSTGFFVCMHTKK